MKSKASAAWQLIRAVLFLPILISLSTAHADAPAPDSAVLGDWEVSRVLMTGGMQPQWSMHEDDPRLLGRTMHIAADSVQFGNADTGCTLRPMAGGTPQSMRSLFAKQGSKRPAAMKGALYGRLEDYELGALRGLAVKLFEVRCQESEGAFLGEANWLAATASPATLLMPYQPDALLVLRRLPPLGKEPDASQREYCRQARSPSDQAICADRQLWQMHRYTISAQQRAQSPRPEINEALAQEIAAQQQKRQACNGERSCLYTVLDRHIELLVQRW